MKIVLISINLSRLYTNTGIDYIAQYLRDSSKNHTVLTKFYFNVMSIDEIINDIPLNCDIYGFSVFQTNYLITEKISAKIKKNNRFSAIIWGGHFISMNYIEILKNTSVVDYCILGDGEKTILRLIESLSRHNKPSISDKNIATCNDFYNKKAYIETDFERKKSYDYYKNDLYLPNELKIHPLFTKSNICVGSCSFCCSKKGKPIYRSVNNILSEIVDLANTYDVKNFWFTDDDIFDVNNNENRHRLNSLFDKIKETHLNIVFSAFAKPISICDSNNIYLIQKMKEIGFHHIFLGIDGGNIDDISLYNKRSTLQHCEKAISILRNCSIGIRFGMIFINPYSTLKKFRESYNFLIKIGSTNFFHYGGLKVQLLSGTKLLKKVESDGLLRKDYSFLSTDAYKYMYPEVEEVIYILDSIMPKINLIKNQFNTLRHQFEITKFLNKTSLQYESLVNKFSIEEFNWIKKYFYKLYIDNDYKYCLMNISSIIDNIYMKARKYTPIINDLKEMCISANKFRFKAL